MHFLLYTVRKYFDGEKSQSTVRHYFYLTVVLMTACTQATRWSASVIKVRVVYMDILHFSSVSKKSWLRLRINVFRLFETVTALRN